MYVAYYICLYFYLYFCLLGPHTHTEQLWPEVEETDRETGKAA